jgi:hypothetical protein
MDGSGDVLAAYRTIMDRFGPDLCQLVSCGGIA